MELKHDVTDRIVLTSQLIDKDLLQGQGQGLHQHGRKDRHPAFDDRRLPPDDQGVDPPQLGDMKHVQIGGQLGQLPSGKTTWSFRMLS